jgi:hypothetical protein
MNAHALTTTLCRVAAVHRGAKVGRFKLPFGVRLHRRARRSDVDCALVGMSAWARPTGDSTRLDRFGRKIGTTAHLLWVWERSRATTGAQLCR